MCKFFVGLEVFEFFNDLWFVGIRFILELNKKVRFKSD